MRYRRCANRIALSSVQRSDFLLIGCDRSLARRSIRLSSRRSPQPKTAPDAEPTRARYVRAWQGPIPHQFLLNDIESILPGPLETGAGCDLTGEPGESSRYSLYPSASSLGFKDSSPKKHSALRVVCAAKASGLSPRKSAMRALVSFTKAGSHLLPR